MAPQSGVTYVQKPAFIDKMIEVGSHHFFKSFGNLNLAAAEAENGENIGISAAAGAHASQAYWHLQKTLELYDALVISIEPLPVSDRAKKFWAASPHNSSKALPALPSCSTILSGTNSPPR